jgi:hypothetical protein
LVCFTVTVRGCDATVDDPLLDDPALEPPLELLDRVLDARRVVVVCATVPLDVRVTGAGVAAGVVVSALALSTAEMLSIGARCCAASDRSVFSALSAGLLSFRPHAPAVIRAAIASAVKCRVMKGSSWRL